jgi:DNA polymerase III subunit chi
MLADRGPGSSMTRVQFVRLAKPEKAKHLCVLAEEFFGAGKRVLVMVVDDNQAVTLDSFMWVWQKGSFIPHALDNGTVDCIDDPVVIGTEERNPNGAQVLIMGKPCSLSFVRQFETVIDFAETYEAALTVTARQRFQQYREAGFAPVMRE